MTWLFLSEKYILSHRSNAIPYRQGLLGVKRTLGKEAERWKKKEDKEKAKKEAKKLEVMEDRLNKSVNQILQPILDNIYSTKKAKILSQNGKEKVNNGSQGGLANGEC